VWGESVKILDRILLFVCKGKNNYEYWKVVFESAKNIDGVIVLAKPLNFIDMIQQ